jgi:hypothetical protein
MPRVPTSVSGLIDFCGDHASVWQSAPSAIGLHKAATLTANGKVSALRKMIASMIRTIVNFAEDATDPDVVFAAAQIDPTSPRTPSVPPGQPGNITATLDDEGNITLKWKCVNPPGGNVVYSVMRREGATGAFAQVGITGGKREFVDQSIPAGSPRVEYVIRGVRGQLSGPASATFPLYFGHTGGGGGMTMSTEKAPFKVAA